MSILGDVRTVTGLWKVVALHRSGNRYWRHGTRRNTTKVMFFACRPQDSGRKKGKKDKSDEEWNETTPKTKKVVEPDAAILAGLLPAFVDCRFDNVITCATRQLLPSPESGSNLVTVSDRR